MSAKPKIEVMQGGGDNVLLFVLSDAFATVSQGDVEDVYAKNTVRTTSIIASDIVQIVPEVEKVRVTSVDGRDAVAVALKEGKSWDDKIESKTGVKGRCKDVVQGLFEKRIIPNLTGASLPQMAHDFRQMSDDKIKQVFGALLPTVMVLDKGTAKVDNIDRSAGRIDATMGGACPTCHAGVLGRDATQGKIQNAVGKYLGMEVNFT